MTEHPVDFHIRCDIEQLLIPIHSAQKMQKNRMPYFVRKQKLPFSWTQFLIKNGIDKDILSIC